MPVVSPPNHSRVMTTRAQKSRPLSRDLRKSIVPQTTQNVVNKPIEINKPK